ncbi:amidohydrolase family protein [Streptomyces sp. HNM0574]|uniref:amidohydrolase family protein n=1 Tax=Streptomyces sp. HNM0574 TaxID=2714954 RepID=UPI00146B661A|nr:amidohydrolase family protein [Streptomyces sp. HNM0574]NLU68807.1 amidohydrolase family protein [Streptomyces sp. HNM0574]
MTPSWTPRVPGLSRPSRRTLLKTGVVLGGGAALELGGPAGEAPAASRGLVVRQATNIALSCHPASGRLVFDAHNVLWLLPLEGGTATRLTDDLEDATWPSFFPDGKRVAFQSFRNGSYDICAVDLATGEVERLTDGPGYDVDPAVSPDGTRIAYVSDTDGTSAVWVHDLAEGRSRPVAGTDDEDAYRSPTWHPDGRSLACVAGEVRLDTVDLSSGRRRTVHTAPEGHALRGASYGPGGQLAHIATAGPEATLRLDGKALTEPPEEPAPFPPGWLSEDELVHAGADGRIVRRRTGAPDATEAIPFAAALAPPGTPPAIGQPVSPPRRARALGLAGPVLSPDASAVCFRALGALWHLRLDGSGGSEAEKAVDDGYFAADPSWFPDGKSVAYSSDRTGVPNLWKHTFGSAGGDEQLTDLPNGAVAPGVAPDGKRVAYQDQAGATWVLDLKTRDSRRIAPASEQPGRPSWCPESRRVAWAVTAPVSARDANGHHRVQVVDTASGKRSVHAVAPHRSLATRGDDGPVWSPDGRSLLAVVDSLVHRIPVAADGTVTGEPVPLSERVADAVSVSARGDVLFLSLGELVLLPHGPATRATTYTPPLTCVQRPAPPRTVIRAGALWDGRAAGYRRDVDLTLEDGRITSITPARRGTEPTVDASDRTVLPGLIDVHNHWHLRGRQWAGRQGPLWLAYGVTTSRSTGDPAYRMAETRESLHSGAAVGPRYLGSGEPLDGTRCHFGFMRCVSSAEQLDRELERVLALDYNVVKSYQRLPVGLERRLVRRLRAAHVPVVSHYLYPAMVTGLNGMEHTGGENRLGYSRTLSFAGGRTAEDTVQLLSRSHMWVSSTLLFAHEMFLESSDLVTDRRTRTLFPSWEYAALKKQVEAAGSEDTALDRAWTEGDVDLLLRVHRAGGTVVAGTDAPLDNPGIGLHQNLRAMVKHGFSPREALTTATGNAARALGAEDELGTLRAGARADLLIVDGDPLRDITAAARVDRVFVDGHGHRIPELLAPYEKSAGSGTPAAPAAFTTGAAPDGTGSLAGTGCCRPRPGTPPARTARA